MSLLLQSLLCGHAGVKNSDQWDFDFSDRTLCYPDGSCPGRYVHSGQHANFCKVFFAVFVVLDTDKVLAINQQH